MNVAILIAVENYSDQQLPPLPFALSDAHHLAEVWMQLGFDSADQVQLFDQQATKSQIESRVRRTLKGLDESDQLIVYFTGHCVSDHDQSYLVCHDTKLSKLAETSISLEWLCKQLHSSDCQQVVGFIDPRDNENDIETNDDVSKGLLHLEPLRDYFTGDQNRFCFIACASDESSYSSGSLKRSVWSHLVAEAFSGAASLALNTQHELTPDSLQRYLENEVPRVLKRTYVNKKPQSPWALGPAGSTLVLADLSQQISSAEPTTAERSSQARNLALVAQSSKRLKTLSGYRKEQKKPDRIGSYAQEFVAKVSAQEIKEAVDNTFGELKRGFEFKRADLHLTHLGDGSATIITPYFNYSITVELDPEDLTQVIFRQVIDSIKEPDQIFTPTFAKIFGKVFDSVEFQTPSSLKLSTLIDRIEELKFDHIELEYDPDATYCQLQIKGVSGTVLVKPDTISIKHDHPQIPAVLLRSFFEIQSALANQQDVPLISIGEQRHRQ